MIPVNEPLLNGREIDYVTDCIRSGWVSSAGKYIEEFEERWAAYCGMKHGVAVSNGTTALQLAVACLGLQPGDEIIMPSFTIISCALAAIYNGVCPVFVDADLDTWTIDVSRIEEKITPKTRAIMPVHIYGHPCDMDPIRDLAKKHNLLLIEDAAEAHGAEYNGRICGGEGDISCFSFYANKIITTGEGGMLLTKDEHVARRARSLRNLCFRPEQRFFHTELGHNFRLTNVQAAIGLAQLLRVDDLIKKKRWIGQAYNERLRDVNDLILPTEKPWAKNVYWMYGVVLGDNVRIDATVFASRLRNAGVDTRPFFLGLHEQPALQKFCRRTGEPFPITERISRRGLYLPSGLTLTANSIDIVADAVKKAVRE